DFRIDDRAQRAQHDVLDDFLACCRRLGVRRCAHRSLAHGFLREIASICAASMETPESSSTAAMRAPAAKPAAIAITSPSTPATMHQPATKAGRAAYSSA